MKSEKQVERFFNGSKEKKKKSGSVSIPGYGIDAR